MVMTRTMHHRIDASSAKETSVCWIACGTCQRRWITSNVRPHAPIGLDERATITLSWSHDQFHHVPRFPGNIRRIS